LAPGVLSTGDDDAHATFSPDGRLVYFIKNSPDFAHWTVLVVERRGDGFAEPEVASFSGRYSDADVSFTTDGQTPYFVSNRPRPVTVGDGTDPRYAV
jgi:Tol biopolymer transport system component